MIEPRKSFCDIDLSQTGDDTPLRPGVTRAMVHRYVIDPHQSPGASLGIKADMALDYSREYWLDRATYARAMAEKTPDPQLRQQLIEIAASYDRLAQLEEESLARRDLPKAE